MNYILRNINDEGVILENVDLQSTDNYSYHDSKIKFNTAFECDSSESVINYITKLYYGCNEDKNIKEIHLLCENLLIIIEHPIIESYSIDPNNFKTKANIVSRNITYYDNPKIYLRKEKLKKLIETK